MSMMFSVMVSQGLPGTGVWKTWVDHITKQKEKLGFTKACFAQFKGGIDCNTSGFHPNVKEIQMLTRIFQEKVNNNTIVDRITIKDKTYMIKTLSTTQLVAFNGPKYVIINRTKTKLVLAICDSKSKYEAAALWLHKLCLKLVEKDF